ncbi:MAG: ribonuclease Z, partial [Gemmatimonadetes bacterium]|nr:ribonuclease Z [Gemmatimonadota bacterium]
MSARRAATLTVVGAGTLLPDPDRGSASFHVRVEAPTTHSILMDVGSGALHGLPRAGVDWRAIDTVALTHFHPDHLSDLPALLAAYRYDEAATPLTIVGPRGLQSRLEAMAVLHGPWILAPSRPLTVVELDPGASWTCDDQGMRLDVHDTPHTPESVALRVTIPAVDGNDDDLVVGYTGDTGPSDTLPGFLEGCAVLIAECALVDPPELDTHLSPSGVARLAREANPDLLLLSHVYPPQLPHEAVEAVRRFYPGRV